MLEPLLHRVRNAVSIVIERPEERVSKGKAPEGTLSLRATASGDRIRIVVEDDGAGIDVDRVVRRAHVHGLVTPEATLTDDQLLDEIGRASCREREENTVPAGGLTRRNNNNGYDVKSTKH